MVCGSLTNTKMLNRCDVKEVKTSIICLYNQGQNEQFMSERVFCILSSVFYKQLFPTWVFFFCSMSLFHVLDLGVASVKFILNMHDFSGVD